MADLISGASTQMWGIVKIITYFIGALFAGGVVAGLAILSRYNTKLFLVDKKHKRIMTKLVMLSLDKITKKPSHYKDFKGTKYKIEQLNEFYKGKKKIVMGIKIDELIQPFDIKKGKLTEEYIQMIDTDISQWQSQQLEWGIMRFKKKNKLLEYMPYMLTVVVIFVLMIIIINIFGKMENMTQMLTQAITIGKEQLATMQQNSLINNIIPT